MRLTVTKQDAASFQAAAAITALGYMLGGWDLVMFCCAGFLCGYGLRDL
jgi:hypothetical protein